jgi:hypothetical protein
MRKHMIFALAGTPIVAAALAAALVAGRATHAGAPAIPTQSVTMPLWFRAAQLPMVPTAWDNIALDLNTLPPPPFTTKAPASLPGWLIDAAAFPSSIFKWSTKSTGGVAAGQQDDRKCGVERDLDLRIGACTRIVKDRSATEKDRAVAYRQRAEAHHLKGDYDQAIADYREAIKLNHRQPEAGACLLKTNPSRVVAEAGPASQAAAPLTCAHAHVWPSRESRLCAIGFLHRDRRAAAKRGQHLSDLARRLLDYNSPKLTVCFGLGA